jgi:hypothetical protein
MLTRLLPEQISKFWNIISYAIEQSLPPTVGEHPDKMNRILSSALCGKIEIWASYTRGESNKFEGIVVTKILHDDTSDTKNFLIYCLYGYSKVDKESWVDGIKKFAKYALSKKCSRIIAYTDLPHIVEITKSLGGEAKYTFLSFEPEKIVQNLNKLEASK